jgi:hypothetical protein
MNRKARLCQFGRFHFHSEVGRRLNRIEHTSSSGRKSGRTRLSLIRRTILVRAEPHRICQCCSELSHIKVKRALWTWLIVTRVVQFAMNQSVVAVAHVIALITIAHRTSKPVVSLFKKAPRVHGLLDEDHSDIVIKALR